ncbi:hypothetical protein [Bordetella sp. N]|uniref:hypothetical protein n=1 Tax=Bordetella sp. N TaxID=1746199 RepID=UPI00070C191D|nr:hypothetical protein [Bordetella sp. N]ALM86618.1 hypothetical protein ASB57_30115 [Bordetella sp. N]
MPYIMNDPVSRYELNARLNAQDAKLDAAVNQMLGIATRIDRSCDEIRADMKALHTDNKDTRKVIIATGVATVLGVAGFNSSVCSNVLTAFQAGLTAQHVFTPQDATATSPAATPPKPKPTTPGSRPKGAGSDAQCMVQGDSTCPA